MISVNSIMSTNREFGRLVSADTAIQYAPSVLIDKRGTITKPSQDDYLKFGWKRVLEFPVQPELDKDVVLGGYAQDDAQISVLYKLIDHHYTIQDYDNAMEVHITEARNARGYTAREPTLYLNSRNERWRTDAIDWTKFIDNVMEYGLSVQNDYAEGKPIPAYREFISALPNVQWSYKDDDDIWNELSAN